MVLPLLSTHHSISQSILTCELPSHSKTTGPVSIFHIAEKYNINPIYVVDSSISGFFEILQNAKELKKQIIFGWEIVCCADVEDKSPESLTTEHSIIIWILNDTGYYQLLKIHNEATVKHSYYVPRVDEKLLKQYWTENLALSIPFYSGFLSKNALSFSNCIFDAPYFKAALHWEVGNNLPFDKIIENAIIKYNIVHNLEISRCKSIFYEKRSDFKSYLVRRCISQRSNFETPNLDYTSSDNFCIESFLEQNNV